jgi:hypothetical protein
MEQNLISILLLYAVSKRSRFGARQFADEVTIPSGMAPLVGPNSLSGRMVLVGPTDATVEGTAMHNS